MKRIIKAWERGTIVFVGLRFMLSRIKALFCRAGNLFTLRGQNVTIQHPFQINGLVHCINEGTISIGRNVLINSGIEYNPIGGDSGTWLCTEATGSIRIGDNVNISNATLFSASQIEIQNNVFIGGGCKIYDTDFHPLIPELRNNPATTKIAKCRPVVIGENCFIGAHTIILKGTTIGRGSVIGAGSVVTGNIPSGQIWAGNPARFIRNLE